MSVCDVSHDFFRSRWASLLINLVCLLLRWPFYNSKSSKPNGSASLYGRKNRRLLVTFSELSIPLVQWLDLVLAEALVGILFSPAKMSLLELLPLRAVALLYQLPLCHVLLLPTPPLQWPDLVFAESLVKTPHRSSASTMSLLNKLQKLWSIAIALALPLSLLLALTASSAPHSSRELFTESLKKFKELQPINSDSCASTVNISHTHLLAPPLQLLKAQSGAPILTQAEPWKRPLKYENHLWYCQDQWLQSYLIAALSFCVRF